MSKAKKKTGGNHKGPKRIFIQLDLKSNETRDHFKGMRRSLGDWNDKEDRDNRELEKGNLRNRPLMSPKIAAFFNGFGDIGDGVRKGAKFRRLSQGFILDKVKMIVD